MLSAPAPKLSPADVARNVVAKAKEWGFKITDANGTVFTVHKTFTPDDKAAYSSAESDANSLVNMVRRTESGSIWGTDGGSIGGAIGLKGGYMTLHKSGCSKQILSAIRKELAKG